MTQCVRSYLWASIGIMFAMASAPEAQASPRTVSDWDIPGINQPEKPLTPEEAWKQVGLRFDDVTEYVSNEKCYAKDTAFVGCIFAAQVLWSTQKLSITPSLASAAKPSDWGPIELSAAPKAEAVSTQKLSRKEAVIAAYKYFAEFNTRVQSWKSFYTSTQKLNSAGRVDFDKLWADGTAKWQTTKLTENPETDRNGAEAILSAIALNEAVEGAEYTHSRYAPVALEDQNEKATGKSLVGIGVTLEAWNVPLPNGTRAERAIIRKVVPGGGAAAAGLLEGDVLIEAQGKNASDLTPTQIRTEIVGEEGTLAQIKVLRDGEELSFSITRKPFTVPYISSEMVTTPGGKKLGVLSLLTFFPEATAELTLQEVLKLRSQGADGIAIDLRQNGGGLLDQVLKIAGALLPTNTDLMEFKERTDIPSQYPTGSRKNRILFPPTQGDPFPLFLIQDSRSASASEVLAGSLQGYGRAIVVGETSFGKGTAQVRHPANQGRLANKRLYLYRMMGWYLLPPTHFSPQITGIVPDFKAEADPSLSKEETFAVREIHSGWNLLPELPGDMAITEKVKAERKTRLAPLRACVTKNGQALRRFQESRAKTHFFDNPVAVAADVLDCS